MIKLLFLFLLASLLWGLPFVREHISFGWWTACAALLLFISTKKNRKRRSTRPSGVAKVRIREKWTTQPPEYQGLRHAIEFAAEQANDGFPLMTVSYDSPESLCPICGKYAGRLVDVSRGKVIASRFSKVIALHELLLTGIFHSDCTHRLEYVSVAEIPDDIFRGNKKRFGEPGAFGTWTNKEIDSLYNSCKPAVDRAFSRYSEALESEALE